VSAVTIPRDWWRDPQIVALDPTSRDLLVRLLSCSVDHESDGRLTDRQVAMVEPLYPRRRRSALQRLQQAGLIEQREGGWLIVRWRRYFRPAAQFAAGRGQRQEAGRSGGAARAATAHRTPAGQFAPNDPGDSPGRSPGRGPGSLTPTPAQGEETVSGSLEAEGPRGPADDPPAPGDGGEDLVRPSASPTNVGLDDPSGVRVVGTGTGRAKGTARLPAWAEGAWGDAFAAWHERGLRHPPTTPQRRLLWPIVQEFPDELGEWIREAPYDDERSTFGVVAYVLARAAEARTLRRFDELDADEQAEWMRIERAYHGALANAAREMRLHGTGLPEATGDDNPFRLALPVLATRLAEDPPMPAPPGPRDDLDEIPF